MMDTVHEHRILIRMRVCKITNSYFASEVDNYQTKDAVSMSV
jgi:hypothetical protein